MPYKDPEKQKEAMRKIMRERRAQQKAENGEALRKLKASLEFQQFSMVKQKQIEKDFLKVLALLDKQLEEKEEEIGQYVKLKVNDFYDSKIPRIKAALTLTLAIQEEAQKLKELRK